MKTKNTFFRIFCAICVAIQIFCISFNIGYAIDLDKIYGEILSREDIPDNYLYRKINDRYCKPRLIPSNKPCASEEEHVLYAIKTGEADFLSKRETKLYHIVEFFAEHHSDENSLQKTYAAVTTVDYLCDYDLDADRRWTAYSALISRRAVCSGYSRAVQLLLNAVGVKCFYIVGDIAGYSAGHAWNIVRLDDDSFLHIDSTWADNNDYLDQFNRIRPELKYLFLTDENLADRSWNTDFYPSANGDANKYKEQLEEEYYAEKY
ncbi:MAG: hypothetical protein IJK60_11135 [Clostridia bacterium]|nr:hypothetical protein [Clostridia bacterium]